MKTLLETINHTEDYDIKCYVTITISTFIEYSQIRVESPFNISVIGQQNLFSLIVFMLKLMLYLC